MTEHLRVALGLFGALLALAGVYFLFNPVFDAVRGLTKSGTIIGLGVLCVVLSLAAKGKVNGG